MAKKTSSGVNPDAWKSRLQFKGNGDPIPSLANIQLIFKHDSAWKDVLAFDEFVGDIVMLKLPPWPKDLRPVPFEKGIWTAKDNSRATVWLARNYQINAPSTLVEEALFMVADTNRTHPVRRWLEGLKWDRKRRIDQLFQTYCGSEDTPYVREIGKNFLISAVARIMRPGCQVDSMPVLEGPQGVGKSTFLKALFSAEWFLSTNIDITNKDGYQVLQRKWCAEMGEMDSLDRRALTAVKQYITQAIDTYRPSFGRRAQDFPRQIIFAGSTNEDAFLRDATGARRFWPIYVPGVAGADGGADPTLRRVDLKGVERDRAQLFAEAFARFKKGEEWHITDPGLLKAAAEVAESKRQVDPWEVLIGRWIAKLEGDTMGRKRLRRGLSTFDVAQGALDKIPSELERWDEMKIAQCLRLLGFTDVTRPIVHGVRMRVYRKPQILRMLVPGVEPKVGPKVSQKTHTVQPDQPSVRSHQKKKGKIRNLRSRSPLS